MANDDPSGAAVKVDPSPVVLKAASPADSSSTKSIPGGSGVTPQVKENDSNKNKHSVPYSQLFRYATWLDIIIYVVAVLCALINGATMPMFSFIFAGLLDAFFDPASFVATVERYALYLLFIALATLVSSFACTAGAMFAAERQGVAVRGAYITALMRQPPAWHDVNHTGEVASRLSEDVMLMMDGMGEKVTNALSFACQFIAGVILGFIRGPKLAAVVLAFLPLLAGAAAGMKVVLSKLQKKETDAYARAGEIAAETFGSIRTVAANCAEAAEVKRYDAHLETAQRTGVLKGLATGLSMGSVWLSIMLAYGTGLYYGSRLILDSRADMPQCRINPTLDGCITGGTIINVFFAIIIAAFAIAQAAPNLAAIGTSTAAAYRIFQIIDQPVEIDNLSEVGLTPDPDSVIGEIEFRNVTFAYPSRPDTLVLRNFSLRIPAGKRFALVGPSGSGKSTIIALLQRWYRPNSGEVLLDGREISEYNIQWLRERMGLVLQEPMLFQCSIGQNLAYGIPGTGELTKEQLARLHPKIEEAAKAANAHTFVSQLKDGYNTAVGERGAQLSGGQRQRLAIARALIRQPRILLFDEATSALDTRSERVVQAAIDALLEASAEQRTSITIAHRLSTVQHSDMIIVLSHGEIVEQGTHADLMAIQGGLFRSMQQQQLLSTEGSSAPTAGSDPERTETASPAPLATRSDEEADAAAIVPIVDDGQVAAGSPIPKTVSSKASKEDAKSEDDDAALPAVPFSKVFGYQRPELLQLCLALVSACVGGGIMPLFSIVFSRMVAVYYDPDDNYLRDRTPFYMGMFFLIGGGSFLAHLGQNGFFAYVGEKLTRRLRVATYRAMLTQEIGWYDDPKNSSGRLTARLSTDATLVKATTGEKVGQAMQAMFAMGFGLGIAFSASWRLSLVVLAIFPLIAAVGAIQVKLLAGFSSAKEGEEAGQIALEAVSSTKTVFAFGLQKNVLMRFDMALNPLRKRVIKRSLAAGLGLGFSHFCLFASYSLCFWTGAKFIENGWMDFQEMLNTFFAIVMAAQGIGQASAMAIDQGKADKAKRAIFHIIERKSAIDPLASDGVTSHDVHGAIEFSNVHFSYPSRPTQPVLKGVNLRVEPGQTVAIVGPSGSGKSTIVQLLERFYDPSEGSIKIDDVDVKTMTPHALRAIQGLVQQEPVLWGESVAYNIEYGQLPHVTPVPDRGVPVDAGTNAAVHADFKVSDEVVKAARLANAESFINELPYGFATHCGDRGGALSGGQKQRVAIARAIAKAPKLLLLDEATAALDSNSERVVQDALDGLLRESGNAMTKIIIAHRLATIRNADKIVVLHEGVVVEEGTHSQLMAMPNGVYRQLALAQDPNAS